MSGQRAGHKHPAGFVSIGPSRFSICSQHRKQKLNETDVFQSERRHTTGFRYSTTMTIITDYKGAEGGVKIVNNNTKDNRT